MHRKTEMFSNISTVMFSVYISLFGTHSIVLMWGSGYTHTTLTSPTATLSAMNGALQFCRYIILNIFLVGSLQIERVEIVTEIIKKLYLNKQIIY